MSAPRPRVVVEIHTSCDHSGDRETERAYVKRDEWDALTPAGRQALLDSYADECANNRFSWGWHVPDADDMKMTEE